MKRYLKAYVGDKPVLELSRDGEVYGIRKLADTDWPEFKVKQDYVEIDHPPCILQVRVPDEVNPIVPELLRKNGIQKYDVWDIIEKTHGVSPSNNIHFEVENRNEASKYDTEDLFLLDYIEYQKGNINAYNYAKKYGITVSELFDKLNYCLNVVGGANI